MAEDEPIREFGRRTPVAPAPAPPPKRSGHVALLLMGTLAIGGGAYALMPEGCEPPSPAMAAPSASQGSGCSPHGSSGGYSGRSSRLFGGDSSGPGSSATSSESTSGEVSRGGFGSFARAFGFSGSS